MSQEPIDVSIDWVRSLFQSPTTPDTLGLFLHYEVRKLIGFGASGIVLEAFDKTLRRVVAIKFLWPRLADDATARERFLREARAAAAVLHENVVSVYAVNDRPISYMVMEHVAGETLQNRLDRLGSLPTGDVVHIGRQIAAGLAAAHAQGLIHRDLNPANILLSSVPAPSTANNQKNVFGDVAKIADFGLARAAEDENLTQDGVIVGTPLYLAPEQAQAGQIDHRADLFSLGCVLVHPVCRPTSVCRLDDTGGFEARV